MVNRLFVVKPCKTEDETDGEELFHRAGSEVDKDVTVVACVGTNRSLTLDLQKRVAADSGSGKHASLARLSVESANQKLSLTARGCSESLREVEVSTLAKEVYVFLLQWKH